MTEKETFLVEFGERVAKRRLALNMTQYDLANKVGFSSRQAISLIEKGKRSCTQKQLQTLAEKLNCSIEFLMGWNMEDSKKEMIANINSELSGMNNDKLEQVLKFAIFLNRGDE